jgi:uncharacterized membrane protein
LGDKKIMSRYTKTYLVYAIITTTIIIISAGYFLKLHPLNSSQYAKATVLDKSDETVDMTNGMKYRTIKVLIKSGQYKEQVINIKNYESKNPFWNVDPNKGDNIILYINKDNSSGSKFNIFTYERDATIYLLVILFIGLILLFGGLKGLKSLLSLIITLILIMTVLLPSAMKGKSPVTTAIIIAFVIYLISFLLIAGFSKKSLSAIIGTSIGLITAGIIIHIAGFSAHITGYGTEEALILRNMLPKGANLQGIVFASFIIGAVGALIDTTISIPSAIEEITNANPNISAKTLIRSGLNVGRDIMGAMSNALILAYVGSSMMLLILFTAVNAPLINILNSEIVATEMIRVFAGSIGLVVSIPATALVAGYIYKPKTIGGKDEI